MRKIMKIHLEFFSPARIALTREVQTHWPQVMERLAAEGSKEWPDQLATIAAFCDVLVDGHYLEHQLEDLADKLVVALQSKRGPTRISPAIGTSLAEAITPKSMETKQ